MPDFNIDDILSKFGDKVKPANASVNFNVDEILSKFGKTEDRKPTDVSIKFRPTLGEPGYQVDPAEIEAAREASKKATNNYENPRDLLPKTNIVESIANDFKSGKETFGAGLNDITSNRPASGVGNVALGALKVATSPLTGLVEGGIKTPITDITGNPDIGDRAGIVASGAIPVGGTANKIIASLPKNKMLSRLVEHIGPENLSAVVKDMKANSRLAPVDLSPKVLQSTQELFANGGPVNYLADTSAARLAGAKGAANSAFDASMGATVRTSDKLEQLKNAAREIGKKEIEPFLAANPHTDITDLIKHIDKEIGYPAMKAIKAGEQPPLPLTPYQRELLNVRNKLRSPDWPDRDKMFAYTDQIHDAQSKLRETAQGLTRSVVGSEQNLGKELFGFREKMKDAVGPEYKKKLGAYADEKKIDEAFRYGHDEILKSGKSLEHDPSFFEDWVKNPKRKDAELEAAKEGARRSINAEINGTRAAATNPASRATNIVQNEFNVQRIKALLGEEEAGKLLKSLDDERKIANTTNKVFEGSQTAMRKDTKSEWKRPEKTELNNMVPFAAEALGAYTTGVPAVGALTYQGLKGVNAVVHKIRTAIAKENETQYAKYALPTEGPSRDALIKSLEAAIPNPKLSNRSKLRLLTTP